MNLSDRQMDRRPFLIDRQIELNTINSVSAQPPFRPAVLVSELVIVKLRYSLCLHQCTYYVSLSFLLKEMTSKDYFVRPSVVVTVCSTIAHPHTFLPSNRNFEKKCSLMTSKNIFFSFQSHLFYFILLRGGVKKKVVKVQLFCGNFFLLRIP